MSLREFIERTDERRIEISTGIPSNFKELEKVIQKRYFDRNYTNDFVSIKKADEETLVAGYYTTSVKKGTNGYFLKTECQEVIILKGNKVVKNNIGYKLLNALLDSNMYRTLNELNYEIRKRIFASKRLLKDLLTGKIYNEQTCIQAVLKNSFGVKPTEVCWKYFKNEKMQYIDSNLLFAILLNRKAVSNLNECCEKIYKNNNYRDSRLLIDAIELAFALDMVVNPKWSISRLNQEHLKMVKIATDRQLDVLDETPIQNETIQDDDKEIQMLNDEKSIFIEGQEMGHCLYTNYLSSLKAGRYLAFSLKGNERATFGIIANTDRTDIRIDQIQGIRNSSVAIETKERVENFVNRHMDEMRKMLKIQFHKAETDNTITALEDILEDLPF